MIRLNHIYNNKVEDILPKFRSDYFDLIIADPPFNKGKNYDGYDDNIDMRDYLKWVIFWMNHSFRVLKETGSIWIYCPISLLNYYERIMRRYGVWRNTICWKTANPTPNKNGLEKTWSSWLFFSKTDKHKYFPFFLKTIDSLTTNRKSLNIPIYDVWDDIPKLVGGYLAQYEVILKPNTDKRMFVYQLPIQLIKRIVGLCSERGDVVLDLFSHSGTTSYTAELMGRKWIAIEQSKLYCVEIDKRIKKLDRRLFK